ncbi:50S ribosomal protein L29 [Mollicutes bacterium LVI A0039]|nr:50S ribosomal protein L29 [Mollicutes bacterium LVI A0039]
MQYSDIKEMSNTDIEAKIAELKKELLNLRFQLATGNLEDTAQIKNLKKDIARLMTALNER